MDLAHFLLKVDWVTFFLSRFHTTSGLGSPPLAKKVKSRPDAEPGQEKKKTDTEPVEPVQDVKSGANESPSKKARYGVARLSADSVAAASSAAAAAAPTDTGAAQGFKIESLGIRPAASPTSKPKGTKATTFDKDSTLRVTVISSPSKSALVFRVQPNMLNSNGSWAEKVFSDNVKKESNWVRELRIDSTLRFWYHNNSAQQNNRGYTIRLFTIFVEEVPSDDAIIRLGEHICLRINAQPNNDTTISVMRQSYFFSNMQYGQM